MFELYKKEITTFFCSATGYLVVGVFLIATWLLLWVIPSDLNVFYGGYATLAPLFDVAPWIYLFLVPAVSMRLIADERRTGTLELLLIRPLRRWQIVGAKYLSGLSLVVISIAPTLIYIPIVWSLGSPVGNLDMGGTMGSYVALVLLAATYMSVGVFASALTDNQIVAFVSAAAMCTFLYVGFDMVGSVSPQSDWADWASRLGMASHYDSMSRGVIDSRDVVYFLTVGVVFFVATCRLIGRKK